MSLAHTFGVVTLAVLTASPVLAQSQQQSTPPAAPPSSSQDNQNSPDSKKNQPASPAKKPSTAEANPFPEDISRKAAQGDSSRPDAPPAATHPAEPGSTAPPRSTPPADSAESSSRSKFEGLGDMTDKPDRISNGAGGYVLNPKMAAEDVRVGGFYMDRHDYKGAYARYKEATLVDPGNADAVFGLAEAARGLNHRDEAIQNYHLYLEALPDSKKAKDARKALAAMNAPDSPQPK